jgi:hypothetical protein
LIVLVLLTTVLVSGVLSATLPTAIFADSRTFKLDTKQNANCDTAGSASPISDSCNQRAANNVNNGIPTSAKPTGTLLINKVCSGSFCSQSETVFSVTVTGNNPQPSTFSFTGSGGSQLVTLGPGNFEITESTSPTAPFPFLAIVSGDCTGIPQTSPHEAQATGSISAGQHLTCNIRNNVP